MYTDETTKDKDHRENNEDGWLAVDFSTQSFEAMGTKRGMEGKTKNNNKKKLIDGWLEEKGTPRSLWLFGRGISIVYRRDEREWYSSSSSSVLMCSYIERIHPFAQRALKYFHLEKKTKEERMKRRRGKRSPPH